MNSEKTIATRTQSDSVTTQEESKTSTLVISARHRWWALDIRELFAYRQLAYFLAWRDIKVRYKQTALGAAWAIIQPLATMIVFTLVFSNLLGVETENDVPYPIFAYVALAPWTYFATAAVQGSNSVVDQADLVRKVYFPRLLAVAASILGGLLDLAIAFVIVIGLMIYYQIIPSWQIVTIPLMVLLAALTAFSVSVWLSALNVKYRDFRYTITFLTMLWMYATPIAYPLSLVPESVRWIYSLNPMVGVVEGFRWALLGDGNVPVLPLALSMTIVLVLLISGAAFFRRAERTFADVI